MQNWESSDIHTKPDTEKKKARTNNLYGSQETGNYDLQATEISNWKKQRIETLIVFSGNFVLVDLELK